MSENTFTVKELFEFAEAATKHKRLFENTVNNAFKESLERDDNPTRDEILEGALLAFNDAVVEAEKNPAPKRRRKKAEAPAPAEAEAAPFPV